MKSLDSQLLARRAVYYRFQLLTQDEIGSMLLLR